MTISRRRFLTILGATSAAIATGPADALAIVPSYRWEGVVLGAESGITLVGLNKTTAKQLTMKVLQEIERLENIFSLHRANSAIRRLNHHGTIDHAAPELVEVLKIALQLSQASEGAFDPTIQPLWQRLYFAETLPAAGELAALRRRIDYRSVRIDGTSIYFAKPGTQITLNGLAQGFITDRVTALFRDNGLNDVLVELGETYASGRNPALRPWTIALRKPGSVDTARTIALENQALATSGGYGTPFTVSSKLHHLINARTGLSEHSIGSVSVIAPSAVLADGLSTTLALLPQAEHQKILKHWPGTQAFVQLS